MKLPIALFTLVFLSLAAIPALADYENGPINGNVDAWTINFGYVVSDTFVPNFSTVGSFEFGVWEYPGDTMTSVDWSITTAENGGMTIGSGSAGGAQLTDQFISVNMYGFNIDRIAVTGLSVNVTSGSTYWLNLQNAVVASGDPVYWDENSGVGCMSPGCPSLASESAVGTIASEAMTVRPLGSGTTPEPGTILLFGTGMLGVIGLLRRKLG